MQQSPKRIAVSLGWIKTLSDDEDNVIECVGTSHRSPSQVEDDAIGSEQESVVER